MQRRTRPTTKPASAGGWVLRRRRRQSVATWRGSLAARPWLHCWLALSWEHPKQQRWSQRPMRSGELEQAGFFMPLHTLLNGVQHICAMVLKGLLYNTVFRRNSTYAAFIVAGAVLGEKFLNDVVDSHWRDSNKGVRSCAHRPFVFCSSVPSLLHPCAFHASRFFMSHLFQKLFNDQEFAQSK